MGGAIRGSEKKVIDRPQFYEDKPDPAARQSSVVIPSVSQPVKETFDLSYKTLVPADQMMLKQPSESDIAFHIKNLDDSHPAAQQAIVHSLKPYPDLLTHYFKHA